MAEKKRIFIVGENKLLRDGLHALLADHEDFETAGDAGGAEDAVPMIRSTRTDLVMLDLSMRRKDGVSELRSIKERLPGVKVMVLSEHESLDEMVEAFRSGADSYFVTDSDKSELQAAVCSTLDGKMFISSAIACTVLETYLGGCSRPGLPVPRVAKRR